MISDKNEVLGSIPSAPTGISSALPSAPLQETAGWNKATCMLFCFLPKLFLVIVVKSEGFATIHSLGELIIHIDICVFFQGYLLCDNAAIVGLHTKRKAKRSSRERYSKKASRKSLAGG